MPINASNQQAEQRVIQKATMSDITAMTDIISAYAQKGILLPRSRKMICQLLREFMVVRLNGIVVGCAGLHIWTEELAEVRSLAVLPSHQGKGFGKMLVKTLLEEASALGLPKVFALTYQESFFAKLGFHRVTKEALSPKVWGDCVHCPKVSCCDEIAMLKETNMEMQQ